MKKRGFQTRKNKYILIIIYIIIFFGSVMSNAKIQQLGDVNLDGKINITDSLKLLRYIAYTKTQSKNDWNLTKEEFEQADINCNGKADITDFIYLQRYIAANKNKEIRIKHPEWITKLEKEVSDNYENITLNKSEIVLTLDGVKEEKLLATIEPQDSNIDIELIWKSSNEAVAKVSEEGLVTAVGEGNAIITVTTENNKQATCVINVLPKETQIVKPESIQLSSKQETLDINGNNKKQLNINYLPSNSNTDTSITWSSSDNSIATVTRTRINNRSKKWKS